MAFKESEALKEKLSIAEQKEEANKLENQHMNN